MTNEKCKKCNEPLEFIDVGLGCDIGPSFCRNCDLTKEEYKLHKEKQIPNNEHGVQSLLVKEKKIKGELNE